VIGIEDPILRKINGMFTLKKMLSWTKQKTFSQSKQTLNRHAYLECIRQHFCNNHPDHASSSEPRTKWQELTKCISTNKWRNGYNWLH